VADRARSTRVVWDATPGARRLGPPSARERAQQTSSMLVIVLTMACTVLAIFDLLLLAGSV